MDTYITYSKLHSLIYPYLLLTGGEDFMDKWEISMQVNMAIQDLINNSTFSFMSEFELIVAETETFKNTYRIFKTEHPINTVHELFIQWKGDKPWEMVQRMPYHDTNEFFYKRGTNILYGPIDCPDISINYERDYIPNDMSSDKDMKKQIPIPFTFVPALMKMIYDNMSMFTFFQWEWDSSDYYGHAKTRLNDLIDMDSLSSKTRISIWGL